MNRTRLDAAAIENALDALNATATAPWQICQGKLNKDRHETVELVGLYWHFVDIVWVLIFTIVYLVV